MKLELPYPPTINHYYVHVGKRVVIGKRGRDYRRAVGYIIAALGVETLDCALEMEILVYPPDKRRRDVDNVQKCLIDSLEHAGVYEDDYQIKKLTTEMCGSVQGGRVIVTIKPYKIRE